MAASLPRRAAALAAASALCLAAIATAQTRRDLPVQVDAASSEFDYKNNVLVFHSVQITQGDVRVRSELARATGLDFAKSRWQFDGKVRIDVPDGFLTSDSATVMFADNRISRAEITGRPAKFEQQRQGKLARGHAGRIDYDFSASTVKLSGDAWLSDGRNEITGQTLLYNMLDQRVSARPGDQGDGRVRITIIPESQGEKPAP
jgi:lipopolysaccharide export system protein LptA